MQPATDDPTGAIPSPTRVLVIEDDENIGLLMRVALGIHGYEVEVLDPGSVDEALRVLDALQPDLLLLDVRLRGFSGLSIRDAVEEDPSFSAMPYVIVSAHVATDASFQPPEGIDTAVSKPVDFDLLCGVLEEKLAAVHLHGERRIDVRTPSADQVRVPSH